MWRTFVCLPLFFEHDSRDLSTSFTSICKVTIKEACCSGEKTIPEVRLSPDSALLTFRLVLLSYLKVRYLGHCQLN